MKWIENTFGKKYINPKEMMAGNKMSPNSKNLVVIKILLIKIFLFLWTTIFDGWGNWASTCDTVFAKSVENFDFLNEKLANTNKDTGVL